MTKTTPQLNVPLPTGRTAFKAGRASVVGGIALTVGQLIESYAGAGLDPEAYLGLFVVVEYGYRWLRGALGHEPGVPQNETQQEFIDWVGERQEHSG